jgi:hypothetical protein
MLPRTGMATLMRPSASVRMAMARSSGSFIAPGLSALAELQALQDDLVLTLQLAVVDLVLEVEVHRAGLYPPVPVTNPHPRSEAGGPGPSNVMRADRRAWAATGHWVASRRPTGGERQQDGRDVVIGVAANR